MLQSYKFTRLETLNEKSTSHATAFSSSSRRDDSDAVHARTCKPTSHISNLVIIMYPFCSPTFCFLISISSLSLPLSFHIPPSLTAISFIHTFNHTASRSLFFFCICHPCQAVLALHESNMARSVDKKAGAAVLAPKAFIIPYFRLEP